MSKKTVGNVIDFARAARELRKRRVRTKTVAQYEAEKAMARGLLHLQGECSPRNAAKAAECLATAARGGIDRAKHELALLHLAGEGVVYDPGYAVELLLSASEAGYIASSISLVELYIFGKHYPRDLHKALELLRTVVFENEPAAMYYLAYIYDKDPQLQNSFEAAYWYRRAAEYGHFKSQIRLASLYATGHGVPHCRETAEAFLDVALESSSEQDPRFLFWQGERLGAQPETEFVAHALIKAAADMQYTPAQRLLLQKGWRQ